VSGSANDEYDDEVQFNAGKFYPYSYPLTEPAPANTGADTLNPAVSKTAARLARGARHEERGR
jgi:hypothetical protein